MKYLKDKDLIRAFWAGWATVIVSGFILQELRGQHWFPYEKTLLSIICEVVITFVTGITLYILIVQKVRRNQAGT